MRLTWRKEPHETGLARVCQGPRGAELRIDGTLVAHVSALRVGFSRDYDGWYWYCGTEPALGILHRNTCRAPVSTIDEAKAACRAYVAGCLKLKFGEKL